VALCALVHGRSAAGTGPPYLQKIQDSTAQKILEIGKHFIFLYSLLVVDFLPTIIGTVSDTIWRHYLLIERDHRLVDVRTWAAVRRVSHDGDLPHVQHDVPCVRGLRHAYGTYGMCWSGRY